MSKSIGTGLAAIRVPETLAPGQVYKLPLWPVINTGDEAACFTVKTDPPAKLINFDPDDFCLEAGEIQQVSVSVALPLHEPKGKKEYVLEAQKILEPMDASNSGSQVGAAVGTKLFFEVGQSPGILGALTQRVNSIWTLNLSLATATSVFLCLLIAFLLFRRAFDFKIKLDFKKRDSCNS